MALDSTNNIVFGRGRFLLSADIATDAANLTGFRDIGECPDIGLNIEVERKDHYSTAAKINQKDKSIVTQITEMITFSCENMNGANIAAFTLGRAEDLPLATAEADQTDTIKSVLLNHGYILGATPNNPQGAGFIALKAFAEGTQTVRGVTDTAGAAEYKEGRDYIIDSSFGFIRFLASGTIPAGSEVVINYDIKPHRRAQVIADDQQREGQLLFVSNNPAGEQMMLWAPHARISPRGTWQLKGDDWQKLEFDAEILQPPIESLASLYYWTQPEDAS